MKYILLIILPLLLYSATPICFSNNIDIYKNTYVLNKNVTIEEALENKKFSKIASLYLFLNNKLNHDFWIKIPVVNHSSNNLKKSLLFFWKNANIKIYYSSPETLVGPHFIKEKDNAGIITDDFTIKAKSKLDIYINVLDNSIIDDFSALKIIDKENLYGIISLNERFFSDSFFLGILLMLFFSGLFLYFVTSLKSYLYYVMFLCSNLLIASNFRWLLFPYFENELKYSFYIFMQSSMATFFLLSLSLFSKEFFELKKYYRFTNTLVNIYIVFIIIMFFIELFFTKSSILPFYPVLLLPFFTILGLSMYNKYKVSALLYTASVTIFISPIFLQDYSRIFHLEMNQTLSTHIQISSTIASIILSFATYTKLRTLIQERRKFEQQACVKSRFTAMGEMIANIAHQWRQPLSHLSSIFMNLEMHDNLGKLSSSLLQEKTKEANLQLTHMSQTIEDFRNFFSQEKEKDSFLLSEVVNNNLKFMKVSLENNNIRVHLNIQKDKEISTFHNELLQSLVTITTNAKDALKEIEKTDRHIYYYINDDTISISDNAGGINNNIISKVFEPYFTTKQNKNGTGLGLYTAKTIIENSIGGSLHVSNTDKGAKFTIDLSSLN